MSTESLDLKTKLTTIRDSTVKAVSDIQALLTNKGVDTRASGLAALNDDILKIVEIPGVGTNDQNAFSWTNRTSGVTTPLHAVTYGNGLYVSVGTGGIIATSPDGITWTKRTSGVTTNIYSVTYANGLFVAAGHFSLVLTSTDGITWTKRTSGVTGNLEHVTYANGLFVAVGTLGSILTSTDAISWTKRTSGVTENLRGTTYGNGLYVVAGYPGIILTSTDGITWTKRTSGVTDDLFGITYGNGLYVAVGDSSTILTSSDGITWTKIIIEIINALWSVTYGNGLYVAVGNDGVILTSTDTITWTRRAGGSTTTLWNITYGNGLYVVVYENGNIATSPSLLPIIRQDVAYNTQLVDGYANDLDIGSLKYASPGRSFTNLNGITLPNNIQYGNMSYGDGQYVMNTGAKLYIGNGEAMSELLVIPAAAYPWTCFIAGKKTDGTEYRLHAMSCSTNGKINVIKNGVENIATVRDSLPITSIAASKTSIICTNTNGQSYVSINGGASWQPNTAVGTRVAYGNGTYMFVNNNGLTTRQNEVAAPLSAVAVPCANVKGLIFGNGSFYMWNDTQIWGTKDTEFEVWELVHTGGPFNIIYGDGVFINQRSDKKFYVSDNCKYWYPIPMSEKLNKGFAYANGQFFFTNVADNKISTMGQRNSARPHYVLGTTKVLPNTLTSITNLGFTPDFVFLHLQKPANVFCEIAISMEKRLVVSGASPENTTTMFYIASGNSGCITDNQNAIIPGGFEFIVPAGFTGTQQLDYYAIG